MLDIFSAKLDTRLNKSLLSHIAYTNDSLSDLSRVWNVSALDLHRRLNVTQANLWELGQVRSIDFKRGKTRWLKSSLPHV